MASNANTGEARGWFRRWCPPAIAVLLLLLATRSLFGDGLLGFCKWMMFVVGLKMFIEWLIKEAARGE